MTREMIRETSPGIGISLGVDHCGRILMKGVFPSQAKPISCKTLTSPTSNECSRILSHNKAVWTSPPCSGKMSWQTDRSTLGHWLKTSTQGSQSMMKSLTSAITSSFQQRGQGNPRPKLLTTHSGISCGRNIQWQFYGPTHIDRKNSTPMDNTSLGTSLPVLASPLTLNMTKLHTSISMGTKICCLLTLTSSPSSPIRSSCHENEGVAVPIALMQALAKVADAEGTKESNWEVCQNSPFAVNSTRQLVANIWTVDSPTSAPPAL